MAEVESKTCLRCKQSVPLDGFHRDKNRRDGRYPYCRKCHLAEHRVRTSAPEWKEHKREYDRQRYLAHPERARGYQRANYDKNKEAIKRRAKEWVERNRDRRRLISQSYKHRRRAVERDGMSWRELRDWKAAQPKICHWCGKGCARGFVVDHITPLSKGGKHEAHNLAIACRPCNARKSAKDPIEFAQSIGRLL
jgi:5-methylcytosine-specific restriction endonuclease McrA